jgi:hypothetical protein
LSLILDYELPSARSDSDRSASEVQPSIIKFAFLVKIGSQSSLLLAQTPCGLLNTPNNVKKPSLTTNHRHATAQLRLRKAVLGDARYG